MYVVILAGGGGTRLWPLSRPDRPKPFLPLFGEESLLQATVRRLRQGDAFRDVDIFVVADRRYGALVKGQVGRDALLIAEPSAKNTAAAIALAAATIDRPDDEVMIVLPADHYIDPQREGVFRGVLSSAANHLAGGSFERDRPLVTLGVEMTRPATEYGYLLPDVFRRQRIDGLDAYPLVAFEEKPDPQRAAELYGTGGVAWNAGIFLWQRLAIRDALEKYTPLMTLIEPARSEIALSGAYDQIHPISIDYAVMEGAARSHDVVMGTMNVGWSDVGGWSAILDVLGLAGDGLVVQPGVAVDASSADLIVERKDGRLVAGAAPDGTMVPQQVIALLRGARGGRDLVQALLDRCAAWEAAE